MHLIDEQLPIESIHLEIIGDLMDKTGLGRVCSNLERMTVTLGWER